MTNLFLVDERVIVAEHDRMLASDPDLSQHLGIINASLDLLSQIPALHAERDANETALLRLGIRCFNSGASALRLLRCGYFQPAMTMARDLFEVQSLLLLFTREPGSLDAWLSLPDKERRNRFSPGAVRDRLDKLAGYTKKKRAQAYDLLCQQAAHANPGGFHLISPEGETRIGPFSDYGVLRSCSEELAQRLAFAAITFSCSIRTGQPDIRRVKADFVTRLADWQAKYLPNRAQEEFLPPRQDEAEH
ncbi:MULTISPECIES: hypothetical protein [unclassified Haematobacter]|uniref:hypothetical protein n=1 Tax=unclassified Haematobacter TaxID=2640585 RepID=UPI0025C4DDD5|nr:MULTISPECIES: hypothetical protein [unclassified Haematobacter]